MDPAIGRRARGKKSGLVTVSLVVCVVLVALGLVSLVMSNRAANSGADNAMMTGHMANDTACSGPCETTCLSARDAKAEAERGKN